LSHLRIHPPTHRDLKLEVSGCRGVDIYDIEASTDDDALRLAMYHDFMEQHPDAEEDKKRLEEEVMRRRARSRSGSDGYTTAIITTPVPGS